MVLFGAAWVTKGSFALTQKEETEPTQVSIFDLETGVRPEARWLEITGGHLFWLDSFKHVRVLVDEDGDSTPTDENITKEVGVYVPLVSARQAQVWMEQSREKRSFARCSAFVYFSNQTMAQLYPDVARGEPKQLTHHYTGRGTVRPIARMDRSLRNKLASQLPGIDTERTMLVHHGSRPAPRGVVATWIGFGFACSLPGVLWIRWRRRRRTQPVTIEASKPWGPAGVPRPPTPTPFEVDPTYHPVNLIDDEPEPTPVGADDYDADDGGDDSGGGDD
jgi:hypothetical protein